MKKFNVIEKINIILFLFFIGIMGARVYYSDKASLGGGDLYKSENELEEITKSNQHLKSEILKHKSLSVLYNRAYADGYIDAEIEYIDQPDIAAR